MYAYTSELHVIWSGMLRWKQYGECLLARLNANTKQNAEAATEGETPLITEIQTGLKKLYHKKAPFQRNFETAVTLVYLLFIISSWKYGL